MVTNLNLSKLASTRLRRKLQNLGYSCNLIMVVQEVPRRVAAYSSLVVGQTDSDLHELVVGQRAILVNLPADGAVILTFDITPGLFDIVVPDSGVPLSRKAADFIRGAFLYHANLGEPDAGGVRAEHPARAVRILMLGGFAPERKLLLGITDLLELGYDVIAKLLAHLLLVIFKLLDELGLQLGDRIFNLVWGFHNYTNSALVFSKFS